MAIDTAEKRKSISGINLVDGPGVTPNSGKDQEWRQESGYSYSGIAADTPAVGGWHYQRDAYPLPASLGFGVG